MKVLVVDDDRTNRMVLRALLEKDRYEVLLASDGREAVEQFESGQPDLVLMDVMMPNMDGYEATRRIKSRSGDRFVPVIFLTALTDEESLAKCVACGGDDFLTKPYNRVILKSKIDALERVRRLYSQVRNQRDQLSAHQKRLQQEQEVAEKVFANIVHPGCLDASQFRHLLSPMSVFNGDLLLAARKPSGGVHVILGDFTGHGLSAAIGAMPVSEVFYSMTAKGFSISEIAAEINRKLHQVLPSNLFCAAALVEINPRVSTISVWNGGLPDVLVYGTPGDAPQRLPSRHVPLGVNPDGQFDDGCESVPARVGDRIYLYTDGVIEARNAAGELFGQERLEQHFRTNRRPDRVYDEILSALTVFRGGVEQEDDITLMEVTCDAALLIADEHAPAFSVSAREGYPWQLLVELHAENLRRTNPVSHLIQALMELQGLYEHRERLYTILAELYSNALDHGVLKLDSAVKRDPNGFSQYYAERERRLQALEEGWIRIGIEHAEAREGGKLVMRVEDSGEGFDQAAVEARLASASGYSGRGITLVRTLCREFRYYENGRVAEATYEWLH